MKIRTILVLLLALCIGQPLVRAAASPNPENDFDMILRHARIVDGSGNPWYRADVGIGKGHIEVIGDLSKFRAPSDIDLHDLVLAPGFIDLMGTSSWELLADPRAASKIQQGITLMVAGEGESVAPTNGHSHQVYACDQDLRVLSGRRGDRGSGSAPGTLGPDGGPTREDHIR